MADKIVNGVLKNYINERNTTLENNKGKYEAYDKQLDVIIGEGYDVYANEENPKLKEQNGDILSYTHGGKTEFSKELHGEYGVDEEKIEDLTYSQNDIKPSYKVESNGDILSYTHGGKTEFSKELHGEYGVDENNLKCYLHGEVKPSYKVSHYEGFNDYISYMIDIYAKEESYAGHLTGLMGVRESAENLAYSIVPSMEGKSAQDVINEILQYSNPKFAMEGDKVGVVRNIDIANAVKGVVTTNINNFSGKDTKLGLITNQMYSNTLLQAAQFNSMRKTKYITPELEKLYGNNLSNVYNLSTLFSIDTDNGRIIEPDSGHYAGVKMPNGNVFDYLPSVIGEFVLPAADTNGNAYDWSTYVTHGEDDLRYGNTNNFEEHLTTSQIIQSKDTLDILTYSEGATENNSDTFNAAEYSYADTTTVNPVGYVKIVDNITDLSSESILSKTNKFLKQRKINTMISRFYDGANQEHGLTQSAVSQFGISHGRNLLTKDGYKNLTGSNINAYTNPYCRVWTVHHQYSKMKNLIRPFIEEDSFLPISELQREWFMFRGENGGSRLSEYGVLNKNGMVNITPTKEGEVDVKQCMFSIENLAWKDVLKDKKGSYKLTNGEFKPDNENVLSPEQIGEHGGRIMWFPPYDLNFQETASAQWSKNEFIGRGEPVFTYTNSIRSGTLDFTILVDHPSVVDYWMLDKKHATGNEDDEQTLMRFFAGCETINPTPDVLEKMVNGVYKGRDPKLGADGKDIIFYTFFPNNYSGIDFFGVEKKSSINPFDCIFGNRGKEVVEEVEEEKPQPEIKTSDGNQKFEVLPHGGPHEIKFIVENRPEGAELEMASILPENESFPFKYTQEGDTFKFEFEPNNSKKARLNKYEVALKTHKIVRLEIFIFQKYNGITDSEFNKLWDSYTEDMNTTLEGAVVTADKVNKLFMGYEMGVNPLSTTDFYYEENDDIIEYFLDKLYTYTEAESIFDAEELSNFASGKTITIMDLLPQVLTEADMEENNSDVSGNGDLEEVEGEGTKDDVEGEVDGNYGGYGNISGDTPTNNEIVGFYYEYYNSETSKAENTQNDIKAGEERIKEIEGEIKTLNGKINDIKKEIEILKTQKEQLPAESTASQQLQMLIDEKLTEALSLEDEIKNKQVLIEELNNNKTISQGNLEITDGVKKKIEKIFKPTEEKHKTNPLYICYEFLSVEATQKEIEEGKFNEKECVFNEPFTPYARWKAKNIEKVKVNGRNSKPFSLLSSSEKVIKTQYGAYWSIKCVGIGNEKILDIPYIGFKNKTKFTKSGIPFGKLEKNSKTSEDEDENTNTTVSGNTPSNTVSGNTEGKETVPKTEKEKYFINNGKVFTYDNIYDANRAALTILEIPKMSVDEFKKSDVYIAIRDDSPEEINHYMYKEIYEVEEDKLVEELLVKLKEEVGGDPVKFEEKYYENHKFSKLVDMGVGFNYGKFQLFYTGKYNETGDMYETIQDFLARHDFRKDEHQIDNLLFPGTSTKNKNPYEDMEYVSTPKNEGAEKGEEKTEEELEAVEYTVPSGYGFDKIVSDINKKHGTNITVTQIKEWNKGQIHRKGKTEYFYAKAKIVFYKPKKKEEITEQGGETPPANTTTSTATTGTPSTNGAAEGMKWIEYTVKEGDTLYKIVKKLNKEHNTKITVPDVVKWNNINNKNNIKKGQVFKVQVPKTEEDTNNDDTTTNPPVEDGNDGGIHDKEVLMYTTSGITKHTFSENSKNEARVFGKIHWDMKTPKLTFPVDSAYSRDKMKNNKSYYDMESFGLNSTLEMVKEHVSKNATFSFGEVYAALTATEDTKKMLKNYVLSCERGILQKYMDKEGEELEQLVLEADERIEYLYTIFNSGEKPENLAITEVLTKATASSHGSSAKNKELSQNRNKSMREYLKTFPPLSKIEVADEVSKVMPEEKNNIVPVDKEDGSDGKDISSLSAKYGRCCRTTIVVGEKDLTADELAYIDANRELYEEESRRKRARRYDNEKLFFEMLKENDDIAYNRLIDKVKYFSPAFHSITPEGFNARLTFLHQCTRQGPTETSSDISNKTGSASNLAFGRAPFCILRLGDFLNTKIVIDSINISYPDSQWDLNPEGIGVQFMMAKVSMQIHILGGSDISGPIRRLQNAVSFNYYANTSIYDNRSDIAVSYKDDAKPFYNVEARTWYTGNYAKKNK